MIPLTESWGQNNNDTLLIFNNKYPRFYKVSSYFTKYHKRMPTYKLSDLLASDSLTTNIPSLTIKSFLFEPDCYCECDRMCPDGKINNDLKDFIKGICKKKKFMVAIANIKAVDKSGNDVKLRYFVILIKNK